MAAIGENSAPCSGYFISSRQEAESVVYLLDHMQQGGGGNVLWMTGKYIDRGTTASADRAVLAIPA